MYRFSSIGVDASSVARICSDQKREPGKERAPSLVAKVGLLPDPRHLNLRDYLESTVIGGFVRSLVDWLSRRTGSMW